VGQRAALWQTHPATGNWELIDLGQLGSSPTQAWDISNTAVIAGVAGTGSAAHAVVWRWEYTNHTHVWSMHDLGLGQAYCVNDSGIVGGRHEYRPVVWYVSQAGAVPPPIILPCPQGLGSEGSFYGVVYGINNYGQMVGTCNDQGCYWNSPEVENATRLLDMLPAQVSASCWNPLAGWDINDARQIVGYGTLSHAGCVFLIDPDGAADCNGNNRLDVCDVYPHGSMPDCNQNSVPDQCDLSYGDSNGDGFLDVCQLGDLNCDGVVNAFDIDPFVLAVVDPGTYEAQYPDCVRLFADCNRDGTVDAFDIDPFVALLTGP